MPVTVIVVGVVAPVSNVLGLNVTGPSNPLLTTMEAAAELPPPGDGFTATRDKLPAVAKSAVVNATLTSVEELYVVTRAVPPTDHRSAVNPEPNTFTDRPADPVATAEGERDMIAGTGLSTSSITALEVPPPGIGLTTVTGYFPSAAKSLKFGVAVTCVGLI